MVKPARTSAPLAAARPRKSDLRREAILQKAVDLFDRQGYVNTSLDDVAKAVGIKREALYYYYRSRAEILLAIIGPQTAALVDGMARVVAQDLPAIEKLEGAIRNHLQRFDRHCLEMTISLRDGIMGANPEVRGAMQRVWKEYESMWTALIDGGQRDGSFDRIGDPKMVAFGILGMCNWISRWYNPRKDASIEELIRTYFVMVSQGLVPRPAAVRKRSPAARRGRSPATG